MNSLIKKNVKSECIRIPEFPFADILGYRNLAKSLNFHTENLKKKKTQTEQSLIRFDRPYKFKEPSQLRNGVSLLDSVSPYTHSPSLVRVSPTLACAHIADAIIATYPKIIRAGMGVVFGNTRDGVCICYLRNSVLSRPGTLDLLFLMTCHVLVPFSQWVTGLSHVGGGFRGRWLFCRPSDHLSLWSWFFRFFYV